MVALTRDERRRCILELHGQGKGTHEISEILHMSFRDIGYVLKDADKQKEAEQQQTRQKFLSSQAYKLFSDGESSRGCSSVEYKGMRLSFFKKSTGS